MRYEEFNLLATAPDGDALPRFLEAVVGALTVVSVYRNADQIRVRVRRELGERGHPRAAPRALAARSPGPVFA